MITPHYLTSPFTSAAAPFTFGYEFKKGDVPAGQTVVADIPQFQCVHKNYWEDGSLKIAVCSGITSFVADVEKTIILSLGAIVPATPLTLADLKATGVVASVGLTNAKDWTFDTAVERVGKRLEMSNALDVFDAAASSITVDNSAVIANYTGVQDAGQLSVVLSADLSGGTVGGYQTVKYRAKYRARRNISAITRAANARITHTTGWRTPSGSTVDGLGTAIVAVGNTYTFSGIAGMTQLNGMTGTVTSIGTSTSNPTRTWFEVDIDTTGFTDYTGGGISAKNQMNTDDFDDIAYVRTGGGLALSGDGCTYSPTNSTGQVGVSWAAGDWDGFFEALEAGPIMSSWRYRKALTPDPHMVAWLEVYLYADGNVDILPRVENGYLKVLGPCSKQANINFVLNGVTKFDELVEIKAHAWRVLINGTALSYWKNGDPQVYPRTNSAYIYGTRLVPTYMFATPPTASTVKALPTAFPPVAPQKSYGNFQSGMGSGGFSAAIGLIANHDALYYTCGTRITYEALVRHAFITGDFRFHYRDETTNRPIKFSDYPNLVVTGTGAGLGGVGISGTGEYTPDEVGGTAPGFQFISSHHPEMGYAAYLATGKYFFAEITQMLATALYLKQVSGSGGRELSKGIIKTHVGANQKRGAAWTLRTLAQACATVPDAHPLAGELRASLEANIVRYFTKYASGGNNPYGYCELYTDYNSSASTGMWASGFQQDFLTAAFGHIKNLDPLLSADTRDKMAALFAWMAPSIIGRLGAPDSPNEFPFMDAGEYEIPLSPNQLKETDPPDGRPAVNWDPTKGPTGPWWSSWGEIWDKKYPGGSRAATNLLRGGQFPSPGSYFANGLPSISAAVEHGAVGAVAAYNRLVGADNWQTQADAFIAYPVYGIAPAATTAPPPPPPIEEPPPEEEMTIQSTHLVMYGSASANLGGAITATEINTRVFDDVPDTEALVGRTEHRIGYIKNTHPTDTAKNVRICLPVNTPSTFTSIEIGAGTSGLNGIEPVLAFETSAPGGVTFIAAPTPDTGVMLGDIPPGGHRAVCFRRVVALGAKGIADDAWLIDINADTE